MNYLDIIIILPLLYAAYKGYKKGLIIEVATLVALVAGIYGAIHFSFYVEELLSDNTEIQDSYLPLTAMALTFIGIVIGIHFLARLIEKMVKLVALGLLNRIAGMFFSLLKMVLIISFALVMVNSVNEKYQFIAEETQESSVLLAPFSEIGPILLPIVTESAWYKEWQPQQQMDEVVNSVDLD